VYLWVNLCDLQAIGLIGGVFSPLKMMVQESLGDRLLDGVFWSVKQAMDNIFVVVECTEQRAEDMQGGLEVIGQRKLGRKIRTKTTKRPPGKTWRHVAEGSADGTPEVA